MKKTGDKTVKRSGLSFWSVRASPLTGKSLAGPLPIRRNSASGLPSRPMGTWVWLDLPCGSPRWQHPRRRFPKHALTRAEAPEVLEYNWGDHDMRWELEALDGGTRLTLGPTLVAASLQWVLLAGKFASMFWITC